MSTFSESAKNARRLHGESWRLESNLTSLILMFFVNNDFDAYFIARAKALLDLIEDAMGKPVSNHASDEVAAKFGASLE